MARRFLIFGLVGPLATYLGICAVLGRFSPGVSGLPLAYGIELTPFLLCAYIDGCLEEMRSWERAVILGFAGLIASAIAVAIAGSLLFRLGLEVMFFGLFAIVPAAVCSLLSIPAPAPYLPRAD